MLVAMTDFAAQRHFDLTRAGTVIDMEPDQFALSLNCLLAMAGNVQIADGYAPFCKLLFTENFTNARAGTIEITPENQSFLHSGYKARVDSELPVLGRWFEGIDSPVASCLCVVVYDKQQLLTEGTDIGEADYGIVAILGQMHWEEQPMPPITMMRNALGVAEGGSGVPLNREAYNRSVKFWDKHAVVKAFKE